MKSQCTQCGLVFAGLYDFDAHMPGKPGVKRPCIDPAATEGWVLSANMWRRPGFEDRVEAISERFRKDA